MRMGALEQGLCSAWFASVWGGSVMTRNTESILEGIQLTSTDVPINGTQ